MILHTSYAVDDPQAAARAVAWLMGGEAIAIREFGENAWMAVAGDAHGTLVQFLLRGTELHYVPGHTVAHRRGPAARESACHILIETPHSEADVLAAAPSLNGRAHRAQHGPLSLIEFWIDGCLLVEVATPESAAAYRTLAAPTNLAAM